MEILNALQLKSGKRAEQSSMGALTQPVQFLPREEKDPKWCAFNMDWVEWEGLKQLRKKALRLSKNYKIANGVIDKTDYIDAPENDYSEILSNLSHEDSAALDLKFYPIVPNVINTFCTEFEKRNTHTSFSAVDEFSYNEMLEQKSAQVEAVLLEDARQKIIQKLIAAGVDPEDPMVAEQVQQETSPEQLKTLPGIQEHYTKTYRSSAEVWATHQQEVDADRFYMDELETKAFRDSLITDSAFWHFKMFDDDYVVETWNPMLTFYHKSPNQRYISEGQWVGKVDMMTVPDVIDNWGHLMSTPQLESLENKNPVRAAGYALGGYQNDGNFYDATQSHSWNVDRPGLAMRQYASLWSSQNGGSSVDIVDWITRQNEDYAGIGSNYFLRVTTAYWKSQRKIGHLTRIAESGEVITSIIDEAYKVTDKPLYNNVLFKDKNKETLLFGEHIDWIWINEVYGGIKIGPNFPTCLGMTNENGISPIYLGINGNKIAPLKFQFKGDRNIYGCRLPVEGAVFSDYNTRSTSLVDRMKPFQVMYNICNNQIYDILLDELGTVVVFDPRILPQHSLGEDWGKQNYAKAWVSMKKFGVLPTNYSMDNTEGPMTNAPIQKLDLEQSNRLISRINLAAYCKAQSFELIGINPQRMGQQAGRQTATGVEENLNASYAQTEIYFTQFSNQLMPRVQQMRTDLAQHYHATKPSLRLQYMTSKSEKVNFQINGTDLLLRDINVMSSSKALNRAMLEELKKIAVENNTTGAAVYDLGDIMMSKSLGEIHSKLKGIESKAQQQAELEHSREMEAIQAESDARQAEALAASDRASMEKEKDRRANIFIAEIRAAGYGAAVDKNANNQNDFLDFMDRVQSNTEFQQVMEFDKGKQQNKVENDKQKMDIAREKIASADRKNAAAIRVAEVNKNKFDAKPTTKPRGKK